MEDDDRTAGSFLLGVAAVGLAGVACLLAGSVALVAVVRKASR